MAITFKKRKIGYLILFLSIIILQLVLFYAWRQKNENQEKLDAALAEKNRINRAQEHFDNAIYNFFDAESHFNAYFQDYDPASLKEYRSSILEMSGYLDSLQATVDSNSRLDQYLRKKQTTENAILLLKKKLDQLIRLQIVPLSSVYHSQKELSKSTDKELQSISGDIVRISNTIKKKRLLGRIIDAIRNKDYYNKEELIVYLSKTFGNSKKRHKRDDLKNLFLATDTYYASQFNNLKGTYRDLKSKDRELILTNQCIIDNCQEILSKYKETLKAIDDLNYNKYYTENQRQGKMVVSLLSLILALTIALLIYTWYAYDFGKRLMTAKAEIEYNLESKNRLIGMLSHEMKAPLNIISNFTEKIKTGNRDKALDETVDSLLFTSNSLQLTVNQILNFFKNENSQLVLYKSDVNLSHEIHSIINSLKSLADIKKLQLDLTTNQNLEVNVLADNGKIYQLFYNIIGNAIKFTDKGSIAVNCKAMPLRNKVRLEVTITDTGIGIPSDDLKHIFNPYYQSKNDATKISLGAGLGLNLCKEIIALHHGGIEVKSEINKGTEISFFLILEKATEKAQSNKTRLMQLFENKPVTVAFVDDDVMVTTILRKFLGDVNFNSVEFHSANAIKSYLDDHTVDLIITDLDISGYSGLELIREIRQIENQNATAPIVVITGNDYAHNLPLDKEAIDEIIIKPIDREEFYSKLLKILKNR